LVSNILEKSDVYRRGLRYGDEIVSFGGREIRTTNEFKNVLGIYPKGWRVPLTYRRDGQKKEIVVRLTGVHSEEELIRLIQKAPVPESPQPDKKPEPKPGEQPKPQPNRPAQPAKAKAEVPAEIAKLIEPREGFANYYFNRQHQDRVWKGATAAGSFVTATGVWTLAGELATGGKVQVTLGETRSDGEFPTGKATVEADKDLDEQLGPTGSGGLLLGLHLWRRMLVQGPSKFGKTVYQGKFPTAATDGLADLLGTTFNVVDANFLFDPKTGRLAAIEVFPSDDEDVCEIRFFPLRMEVRRGETLFADLRWREVTLAPAEAK
jgi:hypothetical protein